MSFLDQFQSAVPLLSVELCPPKLDMDLQRSVDVWIDSNHFIRRITGMGRFVFMTDGSVGRREEQNLRHVILNLGPEADRSRIVPILTTKHPLGYCMDFAERVHELGFGALVVLGGDKHDGVSRCVEHAYDLRRMIRARLPRLVLGGWATPHGGAAQLDYMLDPDYTADFYLAQIVSHYDMAGLDHFLTGIRERQVQIPGVFGLFFYRSANTKTLAALKKFFPVPVEALQQDFGRNVPAEEICARSVRTLLDRGVRNIYISNLPIGDGARRLMKIEELLR